MFIIIIIIVTDNYKWYMHIYQSNEEPQIRYLY